MNQSLSKETVKNMILDAGYVYINYKEDNERPLGATSGGNSFAVEKEYRFPKIDNVRGKMKGLSRIMVHNASLTVNLKEMSPQNILLALGGGDIEEGDLDHYEINPSNIVKDSDYLDNITLVAPLSAGNGKWVEIILYNALSDGDSLELNLEDENEGILPIQFSAHYDPDDLNKVPYQIRYPKLDNGENGGEEE
ncbi:hypothetical protein HXA31_20420 [Salipaludibacillus agaradhaerens]|uniref:Uncharacterized protein n=1 Tax=Salipaludibacillus agaradhaerens TaxID=76935 RepID=A0A9Q4B1X5_SALAG|nr:hypothetical protein [Salipaludibacillus agaradhaerens]MCR6096853.1 hypothetical protein [Salipaludibacillus agaradhaerens]MCR6116697.1 hypothetical protein [Salipaludibacillus agaradhaerens]